MSTLTDFLDRQASRVSSERVGAREFYREYVSFAGSRDEGALSEPRFGARLEELGVIKRRDERGAYYGAPPSERNTSPDAAFERWVADHAYAGPPPGDDARDLYLSGWDQVSAPVRAFHRAYVEHCLRIDVDPVPERMFNRLLRERGYEQERDAEGVHWRHLGMLNVSRWLTDMRRDRTFHRRSPAREYLEQANLAASFQDTDEFRVAVEGAVAQSRGDHMASHDDGVDGCLWNLLCEADWRARFLSLADALARPKPVEPFVRPEPELRPATDEEAERYREWQAESLVRDRLGLPVTYRSLLDAMVAASGDHSVPSGLRDIVPPGAEAAALATAREQRWLVALAPEAREAAVRRAAEAAVEADRAALRAVTLAELHTRRAASERLSILDEMTAGIANPWATKPRERSQE